MTKTVKNKSIKSENDALIQKLNLDIENINHKYIRITQIEKGINETSATIYGNIITIMVAFVTIVAYLFVSVQAIDRFFPEDGVKFIKFVEYSSFIALVLIMFNFALIYLVRKTFYTSREEHLKSGELTAKRFWYEIKLNLFEYKLIFFLMFLLALICFIAFIINNFSFFGQIIRKDITYIIIFFGLACAGIFVLYHSIINKVKKMISKL